MTDTPPAHRLRRATRVRPFRRWPRRLLLSANILVALVLVAGGSIAGYAKYQLSSIKTFSAPGETHVGRVTAGGLAPENILLIGNETRAGLPASMQAQFGSSSIYSGALSDVVMILHLDPRTKRASVLSIPRDLLVPMPAGSPVGPWQKIDAALNDGKNGPNNLINAIQHDLGIPINHFVEVNFLGFEQTVNALGGIRMYFPEPLLDKVSLLNVGTGCQLLNGQQALALVRSRHLQYDPPGVPNRDPAAWPYDPESDLARIVRDHEFIRVLITTAKRKGLSNPITAGNFIPAVLNQLTMDPGLKGQLVKLASYYSSVSPNLPETTLPVTVVNNYSYGGAYLGDVDFPVQPLDNQAIARWDAGALPTPQRPATVNVYNATGSGDLATQTAAALRSDGMTVGAVSDAPVQGQPSETIVQFHPGQQALGLAVFREFSGAVVLQRDAAVPAGTVDVLVGSLETVKAAPAASPSTSSPSAPSGTAPATTAPAAPSTSPPSTSAPSTTIPVPAGSTVSGSKDQLTPYDPRPC